MLCRNGCAKCTVDGVVVVIDVLVVVIVVLLLLRLFVYIDEYVLRSGPPAILSPVYHRIGPAGCAEELLQMRR